MSFRSSGLWEDACSAGRDTRTLGTLKSVRPSSYGLTRPRHGTCPCAGSMLHSNASPHDHLPLSTQARIEALQFRSFAGVCLLDRLAEQQARSRPR